MITIKDAREKDKKANFEDLPIGQAYEDDEGVVCIKTGCESTADNCICFYGGEWWSHIEILTAKVTPLKTTLTIER